MKKTPDTWWLAEWYPNRKPSLKAVAVIAEESTETHVKVSLPEGGRPMRLRRGNCFLYTPSWHEAKAFLTGAGDGYYTKAMEALEAVGAGLRSIDGLDEGEETE